MLAATTIYLTPYRSREQIVSGALTFAIVAGCPTVSTPYFYAEDLLASGAGVLVPFDDPAALAEAVIGLLDDPERLERARAPRRARSARELAWPQVGRQTAEVLREAVALGPPHRRPAPAAGHAAAGARLAPADHGRRRRDHPARRRRRAAALVGLLHRRRRAPGDRRARAAAQTTGAEVYHRMLARSLGFLRHAWSAEARGMRNFMSYDRRWLDEPHGGDHLGRAAWALGEVVAAEPVPALREPSLILLREMLPALAEQRSPRTMAFAALGLARADPASVGEAPARSCGPRRPARRPAARERVGGLVLGRGRPRLRQRSAPAGADRRRRPARRRRRWCGEGMRSLDWYAGELGIDGPWLQLVGHRGRRRGEAPPGSGDEQPLDAAALVEAEVEAFVATGEELARATRCARSSGSWAATGSSGRCTTSRPAAVTTASASRTSTATREPSRRSRTSRRCSPSTPPASRRRCPNEARAARTDRLAHAAAPLRAVGARDRTPGRRPRPARRGRDAVRHAGLDHPRPTGRRLRNARTRRTTTIDGRVWEALHVAHALSRSAEFDLIHNHLDWLPLALSSLVAGADGDDDPRVLLTADPARLRALGERLRLDLRRRPRPRARLRRDDPSRRRHEHAAVLGRRGRRARVLRAHPPDKGTAQAIEIARARRSPARALRPRAGRALLRRGGRAPHRRRPRPLPRVGRPRGARRGPRARPAASCTRSRSPSRSASRSSSRWSAARRSSPTTAGRCPRSSRTASPACSRTTSTRRCAASQRATGLDRAACRAAAERRFSADRMVDDYLDGLRKGPP